MFEKIFSHFSFSSSSVDLPYHEIYSPLLKDFFPDLYQRHSYLYGWDTVSLKGIKSYEEMKGFSGEQKRNLMFFLLSILEQLQPELRKKFRNHCPQRELNIEDFYNGISTLFTVLLKTKNYFKEEDFLKLFQKLCKVNFHREKLYGIPLLSLISLIEKYVKQHGLSPSMQKDIEEMLSHQEFQEVLFNEKQSLYGGDARKIGLRMQAILQVNDGQALKPYQLGTGPFGQIVAADYDKMPSDNKKHWDPLFYHLAKTSGGKPTKRWMKESSGHIEKIGKHIFRDQVQGWLQNAAKLPIQNTDQYISVSDIETISVPYINFIEHYSQDLVKGMLWTMSEFHDGQTLQALADIAEKCFEKIPGQGPAAAGVGNAAIYALATSKGLGGVAHLSRLKLRIKQNNTQKLIQKYIDEKAAKQGLKSAQIEESAAPDFGLEAGRKMVAMKDYQLVLINTGVGKVELQWLKPDGKQQKSVPAFVKQSKTLSAKLKEMRDLVKQVKKASTAQRDRIDRLYTEDMSWSEEDVLKHYINHGLVGTIGCKLIWMIDDTPVLWGEKKGWQDVAGKTVKATKKSVMRLWHPIHSQTDDILAWRDRLETLKITQPLKQAYREVYLLTEAEVKTATYSNRMAAHIIKQHQFNSLAAIRGWKYSLMGAYDDGREGDVATKLLPENKLKAEFWINEIIDEESFNDVGIWLYVATDQVRFKNESDEDVPLIEVPKLILSEIMRDVDLFVGVASVGNDPQWQDGGPGQRPDYRDYWHSYSFGNLTEVAKTRKAVLERLLPRLKIKDVAHIEDKFLFVKGIRHTYKIHIGSGNILIAPKDQYLCIVPSRGKDKSTGKLFLPFEGDTGLSIVLSKAFLLAEDDKITDKTILSQL